jgi:ATP-binding cassette subfamily B protein
VRVTWRLYLRILGLLAPERSLAISLALANVVLALIHFVEPVLFGRAVDMLSQSLSLPREEVWRNGASLLALWAAVGLGGIVAGILVSLFADRLAHRRRMAVLARYFDHILSLDAAYHGETHSGRLLKALWTGTDHLFIFWLTFFRDVMATFVSLLVLLPMSLALNWRLGLLLVGLIVIYVALTLLVIARTHDSQGEVEAHFSGLAERVGDAVGNVRVVQSFGQIAAEGRAIREAIERLLRAQYPVLNWWSLAAVLTGAASTSTAITIFVVGTWLHLDGRASVGEIITFMGLATQLIGGLTNARGFLRRMFFEMHGLAEFFEVLDTAPGVADRPGARPLGHVRGEIVFEGVSFDYGGVRAAVHDLDFRIEAGQMVALVGATGAGKSTTAGLLQRLWDPVAGRILVDGVDIAEIRLESLRANIGVVFQESLLFRRSIAENLRVGRPDASQPEIERAARLAEAHAFVERLPHGYETRIGERGANLSGGERQRLAIARALLKDPPILILDEATSALDTATEARVQAALKTLMKGRTTLVIAHRLSTVRDADQILVLEHGRIVERGRFAELVARGGVFADLVANQLGTVG